MKEQDQKNLKAKNTYRTRFDTSGSAGVIDHLQKLVEKDKIYNSALYDAQGVIQQRINESINDSYNEALSECITAIESLKKGNQPSPDLYPSLHGVSDGR